MTNKGLWSNRVKQSSNKNHNLTLDSKLSPRGPQTIAPTSRTSRQLIFANEVNIFYRLNIKHENYESN